MDGQERKVKQEAVEEQQYPSDDEDQLTVSKLFLSTQNPHDSFPKVVSENPKKSKRKREIVDNFSDHFKTKSSRVMERAEEVQASLSPLFPSFIKLMLRSHVTKGFWLGLPSKFCKSHLPCRNETIVLEDESGKKYKTNFLVDKTGLSGGWRGFSTAQNLLEGDVVVFHLVKPSKFKVYIVRVNDLAVADLGLLHSDGCAKETDFDQSECGGKNLHSLDMEGFKLPESISDFKNFNIVAKETSFGAYLEKNSGTCKKAQKKHPRLVRSNILKENVEENDPMARKFCPEPVKDQSECDGKNFQSLDTESFKLPESISDFKNFDIVVNGLTIDSELSNHVRAKYYELCCTRKSYLHDGLLKSINSTMAAGIICEMTNIADAIRACKISTSRGDFATWDKTLEAIEMLGMDVGFLRARLNWLMGLALQSAEAPESKRYEEARVERDRAEEENGLLERRILELKEDRSRLGEEMKALMENVQRYEVMFEEEANAPW